MAKMEVNYRRLFLLEVTMKDNPQLLWIPDKIHISPYSSYCLQTKLSTDTQSSWQKTLRGAEEKVGGRDLDLKTKQAGRSSYRFSPESWRGPQPRNASKHRPTSSKESLFSLAQSLDKGQPCRMEPTLLQMKPQKSYSIPDPYPTP